MQELAGVNEVPAEARQKIAAAVRGIRFGSVEITLREGQVVQIERREKTRFNDSARFGARNLLSTV